MSKKARMEKQSSTMGRAEKFITKILDELDKKKDVSIALKLNAFSKYCQFIALKEKVDESEWGSFFDKGIGEEKEDDILQEEGNGNTILDIEKESDEEG